MFVQINVLTEGGPGYATNVLVYCIYHYAFREHNIGYASAVAVLLFVIIMAVSAVQVKLKEKYTIVIVTHNMQQAVRISDHTAFFLLGDLVEFSETEAMFSQPGDKRTEDYITGRFG